jgi:spermidine synthase
MNKDGVLYEFKTEYNSYQVADTIYGGRPSRILYGGSGITAQSGMTLDSKSELLFDYNERFMEIARGLKPSNLLLIGGGGFTLPRALISEFPKLNLDIVEIDKQLLEIAKRFFKFEPSTSTHIYIGDGRQFIDSVDQTYEMIVLDVFIEADIPNQFKTAAAAASLKRCLDNNGVAAFNVIGSLHGIRSSTLRILIDSLRGVFADVSVFPATGGLSSWMGQNFVVCAQNKPYDLSQYLRTSTVDL